MIVLLFDAASWLNFMIVHICVAQDVVPHMLGRFEICLKERGMLWGWGSEALLYKLYLLMVYIAFLLRYYIYPKHTKTSI